MDANNKDVLVRTEIEGNLPNIDPDAQIVFKDYKQEYIKYSKGNTELHFLPSPKYQEIISSDFGCFQVSFAAMVKSPTK